jgi:hypothetical protein|tara:strand:- start:18805 stop:19083 length:279 start_codon:yes stop_codon:yes gene_type:complete
MKRGEKNHIDEWLQKEIKKGINIIDNVFKNNVIKWELYYTGHLQKDILNNFPGRTSKKIFKGYRNHLNNSNLVFIQKKFEEHGYEYYVKRGI